MNSSFLGCNLLNSSFLGCSVLMLTNLIDNLFTWACCSNRTYKQVILLVFVLTVSTQEQVKRSVAGWWYLLRNKISYSKHQVSDLKEQDQELKIKAPRWSEDCRVKDDDQRTTNCLEEKHKSLRISFYILIGSCVQFCQVCWIQSHPQRKGFYGKSLIHCLKIRDWDQCTSCSYTRTPNLPSHWIS